MTDALDLQPTMNSPTNKEVNGFHMIDFAEDKSVKRAEWISAGAFVLTLFSLVFQLGVVWQAQQDQERRIIVLESDSRTLITKVERIDANVAFLAERAREDRQGGAR